MAMTFQKFCLNAKSWGLYLHQDYQFHSFEAHESMSDDGSTCYSSESRHDGTNLS